MLEIFSLNGIANYYCMVLQTGAGKTYTVVGPSKSITPGLVDDGLLGRSLDYMFTQLDNSKVSMRFSCKQHCCYLAVSKEQILLYDCDESIRLYISWTFIDAIIYYVMVNIYR